VPAEHRIDRLERLLGKPGARAAETEAA